MKNKIILVVLSQFIFSQCVQVIDNCENVAIVSSIDQDQLPICQECATGFIVNYDFQSCVYATSLPMAYYSYCQRLDRNRECDEALCTIQIDQNQLFIRENPIQYDLRCAKIDTINKVCLSPRFPYTLDISQNKIIHNPNYFCKIFDGNFCQQNYETFFQTSNNGQYQKLLLFYNAQLISPKIIKYQDIKCIDNFEYNQTIPGCVPKKFNCKYNNGKKCLCSDGEAVDSTGSQCFPFQNCEIYGYAGLIKYCMQCKPGFISNQFEFSIQNMCQQTVPIPPAPLSITFVQIPQCDITQQLNYQSLLILQQFFQNISSFIPKDLNDPNYLSLLRYSQDFYSNPIYNDYKPNSKLECELIPSNVTLVQYCSTYLAGMCISCQGYTIQYYQVNTTLLSFQTDFKSSCQNYYTIDYCLVYSIKKECLVCIQNFYLKDGKCVNAFQQTPCLLYNSVGQCLICYNQYLFNEQQNCISVPYYCLRHTLQNGKYQCLYCSQKQIILYDSNQSYCGRENTFYPCIQMSGYYCYNCEKGGYTCDFKSSLNSCHYQNKNGFYLDQNFIQQKCELKNQNTFCERCFLSNCLDQQQGNCLKGYGWNQLLQICLPQCLNGQLLINQDKQFCNYGPQCVLSFLPSLRVYQCSDCSLVESAEQCEQKEIICSNQLFYSQQKKSCMVYCGEGKIATDQNNCETSVICQDGLTWSNYYKKCVYLFCKNKMAAIDQPCSKSSITLDIYYKNNNSTSVSGNTGGSASSNTTSDTQTNNNNTQSNNQNSGGSSSSNNTSNTSSPSGQEQNNTNNSQKNEVYSNSNTTSGNFTNNYSQNSDQSQQSQIEFITQIVILSLILLTIFLFFIWMKINQNKYNMQILSFQDKIRQILENKNEGQKKEEIKSQVIYNKIQGKDEKNQGLDVENSNNITIEQLGKNKALNENHKEKQQQRNSQQSEDFQENQQNDVNQIRINLK